MQANPGRDKFGQPDCPNPVMNEVGKNLWAWAPSLRQKRQAFQNF